MSAYVHYYATGQEIDKKTRSLALAAGMDIVWESPAQSTGDRAPQSIGTVSTFAGIPTLTMEMGGEGRIPEAHVERMYRGLDNILRYLKVLSGDPQPHGWPEKLFVGRGNWLRARRGGAYYCLVEPGQRVQRGTVLAEVRDAFGETVEQIVAPVDGVVIGMRTYGNIATGQYAGNVVEIVPRLD